MNKTAFETNGWLMREYGHYKTQYAFRKSLASQEILGWHSEWKRDALEDWPGSRGQDGLGQWIGLKAYMWRWILGNCRWISCGIAVLVSDEEEERMKHSVWAHCQLHSWRSWCAFWLPEGGEAQAEGYLKNKTKDYLLGFGKMLF